MNRFRNLKVGAKIIYGYLIALILTAVVGGIAILRITEINNKVNNLANGLAVDQQLANQISSQILALRLDEAKYVMRQKAEDLKNYEQNSIKFQNVLSQAEEHITDVKRQQMLDDVTNDVKSYADTFKQVLEVINARQATYDDIMILNGPLAESKIDELRQLAAKTGDTEAVLQAGNVQRAIALMRVDVLKYLQEGDTAFATDFEARYKDTTAAFNVLDKVLQDPAHRALASETKSVLEDYYQGFLTLRKQYDQQNALVKDRMDVIAPQIQDKAVAMSDSVSADFNNELQSSDAIVRQTIAILLGAILLAIILGLGLGFSISRSISTPIRLLTEKTELMSHGDLTQRVNINRTDEIGILAASFNRMTSNLGELTGQARQATANISSATNQILAATSEQASTAREQAVAVSETTSTVEEARQSAEQTAERARLVSQMTQQSINVAARVCRPYRIPFRG